MAIHARSHSEDQSPEPSCTPFVSSYHLIAQCHLSDFYNYFQHGIDFLLSDHTHVVKKIILHTNVVSTISLHVIHYLIHSVAGHTPFPAVQTMSVADRRSTRG
jgi:hypothetical protein